MKKNQSSFGYWLVFTFCVIFLVSVYIINRQSSVVLSVESGVDTTLPSPSPAAPSQISPDGTHALAMKTKGDLAELYVNDQLISTRTMEPGSALSIPFNTWSPDDKYFFLKVTKDDVDEYLVMTKSGQHFPGDIADFMIKDLFSKSHPESVIVDVTGWAAPTLLIINARSEKEAKMSFWFDVQSQKFIRLSNYFY